MISEQVMLDRARKKSRLVCQACKPFAAGFSERDKPDNPVHNAERQRIRLPPDAPSGGILRNPSIDPSAVTYLPSSGFLFFEPIEIVQMIKP